MGRSGGRPVGTTVARGFKVGKVKRTLKFDTVDADVDFGEWDTSAVNLDAGALSGCAIAVGMCCGLVWMVPTPSSLTNLAT